MNDIFQLRPNFCEMDKLFELNKIIKTPAKPKEPSQPQSVQVII